MKKLITAIMIILFFSFSINFVYASFLSSAISRLQPAFAVAGAAGSKIMPAVFTGTAAGGKVSSWISLAIPGGAMGKIAGAVVGVAGALAVDYLFNNATGWFNAHNLALFEGSLVNAVFVTYPTGYNKALFENSTSQMTTGATAASAACEAARTAVVYSGGGVQVGVCNTSYPRSENGGQPSSQANAYAFWTYYCSTCTGGPTGVYKYYWFYYPRPAVAQNPPELGRGSVKMTPAQVQALLTNDLANNDAASAQVGQAALDVVAAALDNPYHPLNLNAAIKAAYQAALLEGVTAQQLSDLELQAVIPGALPVPVITQDPTTYLTPAQIAAAVQAALAGQGLSAAQIAAAIAAAVSMGGSSGQTQAETQAAVAAALAGAGVTPAASAAAAAAAAAQLAATQAAAAAAATAAAAQLAKMPPPPPPLGAYAGGAVPAPWVTPAVGDFSALFSNFLNSMRNTPLFSLPGLLSSSVPTGGDCTMEISMGQRFGGTQTFSMCNWATGLSAMKAVLLCIASIFAVGIIAKGGGG